MSKLQPPSLTTKHSTQAVSGTTIIAISPERRPDTQSHGSRSPSQSSVKFSTLKSPTVKPLDTVEDDGLRTINLTVSTAADFESDEDNLQHILNGLIRNESDSEYSDHSNSSQQQQQQNLQNHHQNQQQNQHLYQKHHQLRLQNNFQDHTEDPQDLLEGFRNNDRQNYETQFRTTTESYLDLDIFPNTKHFDNEEEYFNQRIKIEKQLSQSRFYKKLKHFIIFSLAGKPIYSLNGTDDIVLGYTGLITTMISTFEDTINEQIRVIDTNGLKISILNRNPIMLVSVSKIKYEMMLNQSTNDYNLISNQLHNLYNYLVSILSKPVISKHFNNRMNFDLRKVLTPVDFHNLDLLSTQLTYGLNESNYKYGFEYYISELLNSSFQTLKLSNSIRVKLNAILLKLKSEINNTENYEDYAESSKPSSGNNSSSIDNDYLFGLLLKKNHLISLLKPRNYDLSFKDLNNLMVIISSSQPKTDKVAEELWLPICMPNFNSNGFLYIYVKTYKLIDVILVSTNKNNFYKLQDKAQLIINKLEMENFKKIYQELNNSDLIISSMLPRSIVHFIFKDKSKNQFVSGSSNAFLKFNRSLNLKWIYYYATLYNSKSNTIKSLINNKHDKKLTYLKFNHEVGFMLSDKRYEFYCISTESKLVNLIKYSLEIIRWCKQNHKRLFNNVTEYSL